jgi:hypothetical protein
MDGLEVLAKPFAFTDLAARVAMLVGPVQEKIVLLPVRATKPVL